MKILLYSSVFWPSIGGIETITETLAKNLQILGHDCCVLTETPCTNKNIYSFKVYRNLSFIERYKLVKNVDIIHSNGASTAMYPYARLLRKPFIWTHNGYQVSCIDGLGWFKDKPAPINLKDSVLFYLNNKGGLFTIKETFKLLLRRYISKNVDLNIAATNWIAKRQPLNNQVVAYTPYPIDKFKSNIKSNCYKYDFIYVGRLVSEKGVDVLIKAFELFLKASEKFSDKKLIIVGDGTKRECLTNLTIRLGLSENIIFSGFKKGDELLKLIHESKIGVIPSTWEEPMGGVSLELLAAGKNLIVSSDGGHAECVGDAALKFTNGNVKELFLCMKRFFEDNELVQKQLNIHGEIMKEYDELKLTKSYIQCYKSVIENRQIEQQ